MTVALRLVLETPKRTICEAMGVSRSSLKRRLAGPIFPAVAEHAEQRGERHIARRISDAERQAILDWERDVQIEPVAGFSN